MYTALRPAEEARARARPGSTVVDPRSYMTYQPFLPEAAAGSLEPRHVVVPLRRVLHRTARSSPAGHVASTTPPRRCAVEPLEGEPYDLAYDELVVALGLDRAHAADPRPGRARHRLQAVEEAIALRNQVLDRLDVAASVARRRRRAPARADLRLRRRRLRRRRGARRARGHGPLRHPLLPTIDAEDMRWVLVEATDRILPEVGADMGRYTVERAARARHRRPARHPARVVRRRPRRALRRRRVRRRHARLDRRRQGQPGARRQRPAARRQGPACSARADLRVEGVDDAWAAGDNAAVPDLTAARASSARRTPSTPSARPRLLADNIVAVAARRAARATTGTSTSARSRASACTRASPRCTASSSGLPGLVHAPDLPPEPGADASTEGPRRRSTGRSRCSSAARSSRSARCSGRGTSSARRPGDLLARVAARVTGRPRPARHHRGRDRVARRPRREPGGLVHDAAPRSLRDGRSSPRRTPTRRRSSAPWSRWPGTALSTCRCARCRWRRCPHRGRAVPADRPRRRPAGDRVGGDRTGGGRRRQHDRPDDPAGRRPLRAARRGRPAGWGRPGRSSAASCRDRRPGPRGRRSRCAPLEPDLL